MYQGVIGKVGTKETYPSSIKKLQVMNKYRWSLCFENCYHHLWSWDYITEKIFDCFKAKVVPVYFGCYNIEQIIPKDLYIDDRDFKLYTELSERLKTMSKGEYEDMVEKGYEFQKTSKLGDVEEFKKLLMSLK